MDGILNCDFQPVSQFPLSTLPSCKFLLSTCLITILSGCAAFEGYPKHATDPEADLEQLKSRIEAKAITTCLDEPTVTCRNKIIAARMHATDIRFSELEETLFETHAKEDLVRPWRLSASRPLRPCPAVRPRFCPALPPSS